MKYGLIKIVRIFGIIQIKESTRSGVLKFIMRAVIHTFYIAYATLF